MKGLLEYLSPFAPDQSGAVAALYTYGGIIVICDAGGCTGNICGFDEPRWFENKSAVFSAGLRDMDAILGRDDRLVEKLKSAADQLGGSFAAIIGTPVPAVIATDYKALKRMAEKKCGMPVLALECTGTHLYDAGAEKAPEIPETDPEQAPVIDHQKQEHEDHCEDGAQRHDLHGSQPGGAEAPYKNPDAPPAGACQKNKQDSFCLS